MAEMGFTSATIKFDIKITNNHDIQLDVRKCDYQVSINNIDVSKGAVEIKKSLAKSKDITLGIPVNLKFLGLGRSIIKVVKSGKFKYKFKIEVNMGSRYGPYKLNYEKEALVSLY